MPNTIKLTHEKEYTKEELIALANSIPDILTYPNGAVVNAPRPGTDYWSISDDGSVFVEGFCSYESDQYRLASQNVFVTEEEAEKALYVESIHNKYLKKIIEINTENNWVADWSNADQLKYYVSWDYKLKGKGYSYNTFASIGGVVYMCREAKDYMVSDEVSINDFKAFLKMYSQVEVI